MMRIVSSPLLTLSICILMALYLIQGRFFGGSLGPEGMILFASVLIMQSVWALIFRIMQMIRHKGTSIPSKIPGREMTYAGTYQSAERILLDEGMSVSCRGSIDRSDITCYSRRERPALLLEVVIYSILLSTLVLGIINYGISVRGYISVSPGREWVDVGKNLQRLRSGFMADRSAIPLSVRGTELSSVVADKRSRLSFQVTDTETGLKESITMKAGDVKEVGMFRMLFRGDVYTAFITVKQKEHDFMAAPLQLTRRPDKADDTNYGGRLYLSVPGATGEGWFDPVSKEFRIKIYMKNELKFDRSFAYGEQATEEDFLVTVTALAHSGRLEVWRKNYKSVIFSGLIVLLLSLMSRATVRPERVVLRVDGEKTFFYTKSKRVRGALKKGRA